MDRPGFLIGLAAAAATVVMLSCVHAVGTADRTVSHQAIYTGTSPAGYIPPGSNIEFRTEEAIRTDTPGEGKSYTAVLTRDVVNGNGEVVAPAGSPVRLVVLKFTEGGPTTKGQVELALDSVVVNGRNLQVSRANRSGGPLGTLVGAVSANGGAKVEATTSGPELQVPADAILTFQTNQPMYLPGPAA